MSIKVEVHQACIVEVKNRIQFYNKLLNDLSEGANNDAKSSAGDKHETARAMMQLEQEKVGKQLKDAEEMSAFLEKINMQALQEKVTLGSLVKTNAGLFYIAAAIGKLNVKNQEVYVLSSKSPLGAKLVGLRVNNKIEVNAKQFILESIL